MRNFSELADQYQFVPVRSSLGNLAGYLHLDATDTKAVLNSKEFHHFDGDENGWFDIELEDHRGSKVLLHNALTQSQSMPGSAKGKRAGSYTSDIFPNLVVLGAENLRNDRTLHQIAFEIEAAENFFVYKTIEWRSLYSQSDRHKVLKAIRNGAWKPPKGLANRSDANDPHDIYVIHDPKTYLDFTLEDMRIRVWHSRSQRGLGWTGHELRITPIVSVVFKKPVSIDEAVDWLWRIKGFFDQLAISDLGVHAVRVSRYKKGWPSADVYLSNEARREPKRRRDIRPTNIPFSRWSERKSFSAAFEKWLQLSDQRRFFRAAVRLSLSRLEQETDPTLVTLLLAGIESLPELREPSGISQATINKMARAAHEIDRTLDLGAIRGLLGALGRTSPKQRLRKIAEGYFVSEDDSDIETFVAKSIELRNKIAHGKWLSENERMAAGDLGRALTYLCVSYDLQTSGFPTGKEDQKDRNLLAISRMNWAWQSYKQASREQNE